MPTPIHPETRRESTEELSDDQIRETFDKLGLNDPGVREFYERLSALEQRTPRVTHWLGSHSHTNFTSSDS